MSLEKSRGMQKKLRQLISLISIVLLMQPWTVFAQGPQPVYPQSVDTGQSIPLLSADQLNNLVAPIALYPDPLLSQILVAATYPLELVEAYQWLQRNPGLTGPALTQAIQSQDLDPAYRP
jgi:hypothetical protein